MPRAGLSTERVIDMAAALVDSEGFAALSLSALAARLGIRPPSLYGHIRGLEDLQGHLETRAGEDLEARLARAAAGRSRDAALVALGSAYREWAHEHPGLYTALSRGGARGAPAAGRILDLVLAVLGGYGLEGEAALHAARTVRASLHGFITLEAGGGFAIPLDLDRSFGWMLETLDRGLRGAGEVTP